jgi:hypothetical protein
MNDFDDILNNAPAGAQDEGGAQFSKEDYAAMKKAERDNVFALSDATALEVAGDGGRFRQHLDVQARFGRYSAVNALLILAQKPDAVRLGDFEHWKNLGCFVKPKQAGISILEPHEYTKEDGSPGVGYNIKKVFDISQVDARKIKDAPAPAVDDRQLLRALVHKAPVKITGVEELPDSLPHDMRSESGAATDPQTGEVYVRKGMAFSDTFSAVAHELAYAETVQKGYFVAEPRFTAYCAAYILCKKHGVDTKNFAFKDAPAAFNQTLGLNAQTIKHELSKIRDAADAVSGRMAKQLDAMQKAAKSQDAR